MDFDWVKEVFFSSFGIVLILVLFLFSYLILKILNFF